MILTLLPVGDIDADAVVDYYSLAVVLAVKIYFTLVEGIAFAGVNVRVPLFCPLLEEAWGEELRGFEGRELELVVVFVEPVDEGRCPAFLLLEHFCKVHKTPLLNIDPVRAAKLRHNNLITFLIRLLNLIDGKHRQELEHTPHGPIRMAEKFGMGPGLFDYRGRFFQPFFGWTVYHEAIF